MTPKEKAKELVSRFIEHTQEWDELDGYVNDIYKAKGCALIAVDEVIQAMDNVMLPNPFKQYWNKVKQEIQAL
jgi:hypothetical protein